jgi:hypothetical protein
VAIIFVVELTLKLIAIGPENYFKDPWNKLDFFITVLIFGSEVYAVGHNVSNVDILLKLTRAYRIALLPQYFYDKRKPRGWGGFNDEIMGTNLTPYLIYKKEDFDNFLISSQQNVYNLVKSWMNMRVWSPTFIDYWLANSSDMPQRLKQYLDEKFSIVIP